jgi:hypothetical protein
MAGVIPRAALLLKKPISRDPVPRITHYRTSVLHLRIVLRHLSIVEGYLRVLVRSLGHALAFPC